MKNTKLTVTERTLLIIAPLFISIPLVLKHYLNIPDAMYGVIVGIGLGAEIAIFIKLRGRKRQAM